MLTGSDQDPAAARALLALARRFGLVPDDEDAEEALLESASLERRPFGLAGNLRQLSRVAYTLRDRLSVDNWRTLNRLTQDPAFDQPLSLLEALNWLDRAVTGLMTLSGFALDGMTRDIGWRFLSVGRRIERLSFGCLSLQVAMREGRQGGLSWLLELADSIITYRSRYMSAPEWLPVLDLLVLEQSNPRSVMFQAAGASDFMARIEAELGPCGAEVFAAPFAALRGLDAATDLNPESARLQRVVGELRGAAFALSDRLSQRVFSHSASERMSSFGA